MLVTLLVTLMPAFLFSGFVYPVFTMPRVFQLYSSSTPTVYFIDISRGIVMRGAGLSDLWTDVAVLVAYTILVLGAAAWLVKKRIA